MTKLETHLLLALHAATDIMRANPKRSAASDRLRAAEAGLRDRHPEAYTLLDRYYGIESAVADVIPAEVGIADVAAWAAPFMVGALELGLTPADILTGVRVEVVDGRWCAIHPSGKRTMGPAA